MSIRALKAIAAAGGGGADTAIAEQSLMFEPNAHLSKNVGSASNRKTWTWSGWVKRSEIGLSNDQVLFSAYDNSSASNSTYFAIRFLRSSLSPTDALCVNAWTSSNWRITNRVFRDTAAWYHIVVAVDTTQASADNRIKIYVNGVQETSYAAQTNNGLDQDQDLGVNAAQYHMIGAENVSSSDRYYSGYMAEVHFIDGTALTPSSFGEINSTTNQWVAKEVTDVTYGTNGFSLKFAAGELGTDSSGNGNDYGTANLADTDVMLDTPNNNFCTLSPLDNRSGSTLAQGNLQITGTSTQEHLGGTFNIPATGKWYFEFLNQNAGYMECGIIPDAEDRNTSADGNDSELYYDGVGIYSATIRALNSTVTTTTNSAGDIYQMAIDSDTGKVWFGTNNTWVSSGNPSTGSNQIATISDPETWGLTFFAVTSGAIRVLNCGQDSSFAANKTAQGNSDANGVGDFYYTPPTNFLALCTSNFPTPTIVKSTDHFNTVTYSGNASTQNITVGLQPDIVWTKDRNLTHAHLIQDSVRGWGYEFRANNTSAEEYNNDSITATSSTGYSLGDMNDYNHGGGSFVSWSWKAGGAGSSNTDADITSTVSANTDAGISVVNYTMPSTGRSYVGHGLGVKPEMIISKDIPGGTYNTAVFHEDACDSTSKFLRLNTTDSIVTYSTVWGEYLPTSVRFGATTGGVAPASSEVIAYCFASVEGFSKIGSYVGNGDADGAFIYTGFRPAYVMVKRTDSTNNWTINDSTRTPYNEITGSSSTLYADSTSIESNLGTNVDFLSNGFKTRTAAAHRNASGGTYIYLAFAEFPFKYANAR